MYAGHFWAITMSIDDYQPWKAFTLFSGEFDNVLIYAFLCVQSFTQILLLCKIFDKYHVFDHGWC